MDVKRTTLAARYLARVASRHGPGRWLLQLRGIWALGLWYGACFAEAVEVSHVSRMLLMFVPTLALVTAGCAHKQQTKTIGQPTVSVAAPGEAQPVPQEQPAPPPSADRAPGLAPIHFDFDRAVIRAQDENELAGIGDYLGAHINTMLTVSGFCDERGTIEYNIALGDRRAQAAREFLVRMGVGAGRIKTISYGEARPVDPGHNEEAWSKNRRDEFELAGGQRATR